MGKYIVSRTAQIYIVVEAATPESAIEIACGQPEELWEIEGVDDDARAEEYGY